MRSIANLFSELPLSRKRVGFRVSLLTLLLLLIVASRAYRLDVDVLDVQTDESWSVWQTFGSVNDILRWTPYDWTPLYYLTLGAWRELTNLHPVTLRWLSVLAFAVGCSAMYRVGRRLYGAGVVPMLAYAAFAYMVFLSTEMRGYALLLAFYPLAIWSMLRYFHRPTLPRALPLGILLAAMFYTSLTSAAATGALVLFSAFLYGTRIWRWIVPAVIAVVLALPEILNKAAIITTRMQATINIPLLPFGEALVDLYGAHTGYPLLIWIGLAVVAGVMLVINFVRVRRTFSNNTNRIKDPLTDPIPSPSSGRDANGSLLAPSPEFGGRGAGMPLERIALGLFVWALIPIALYITNPTFGFFNHRYSWWVMIGVALFLGAGLSRLPRVGQGAVALLLITFAFVPIPLTKYQLGDPPLAPAFEWLAGKARPDDAVLIDPACGCWSPERFAYLTRVYFPMGLRFVSEPGDEQRLWYLTGAVGATESVAAAVNRGRVAGEFFGPPEALIRVYEAPPDPVGEVYSNGMRFRGAEIAGANGFPIFHEGEPLTLRVWWTADQPLPQDYSIGVFLFDSAGNLVLQEDSAPRTTPPQTSMWQTGTIYMEERTLILPIPSGRGVYRLMLALYWYGDPVRLTAPGVDADGLRFLTNVYISAW